MMLMRYTWTKIVFYDTLRNGVLDILTVLTAVSLLAIKMNVSPTRHEAIMLGKPAVKTPTSHHWPYLHSFHALPSYTPLSSSSINFQPSRPSHTLTLLCKLLHLLNVPNDEDLDASFVKFHTTLKSTAFAANAAHPPVHSYPVTAADHYLLLLSDVHIAYIKKRQFLESDVP